MNLSISEIAAACSGYVLDGSDDSARVTSVSIDTRTVAHGALFVPIKGTRVDGHDFLAAAAEKGAVCVLSERDDAGADCGTAVIRVDSARKALMDLAHYYLKLHNVKVIGITGSAGKTTTKDMIHAVLSRRYKTKKTIGNYNNDLGMPLSIFRLEPGDEVIVLEMGMNHAGEIHKLSLTGEPDVAIITNIGDAHIENLGSREGILHAKLEIIDGLKTGGRLILNGDDPLLTGEIAAKKIGTIQTIYPKQDSIIKTEPLGLAGTRCHFNYLGEDIRLTVPVPGNHMVINALIATAAAKEFGLSPDEISQGFDDFTPPEGRLNVLKLNEMTIISDVYNASPASVKEAINALLYEKNNKSRRVIVLGDMAELGGFSEALHREVGTHAAQAGIDFLVAIGTKSKHIAEEFTKLNKNAIHFDDKESFINNWQQILKPNDTVLIKAARSMKFEQIVEQLSTQLSV